MSKACTPPAWAEFSTWPTEKIMEWMESTGCDTSLKRSDDGWVCLATIQIYHRGYGYGGSYDTKFVSHATDEHCRSAVLRCSAVVYAGFNAQVRGFAPEPKKDPCR